MIDINIKLGDGDEYAYINATSIDKLNELVKFLNELFGVSTELKLCEKVQHEIKAIPSSYSGKTTIKVGPVIFPDGKTGYFHVPHGMRGMRKLNMTWEEANNFCEENGFSLPTKEELDLMIKYKDLIDISDQSLGGKFSDINTDWIWSSSEYNSDAAWAQSPSDGNQIYRNKSGGYWVVPFKRVNS